MMLLIQALRSLFRPGAAATCFAYGLTCAFRNLWLVLLLGAYPALAEPDPPETPVTILMLGDSLTHGYGLAVEEGIVPRLQDWLSQRSGRKVRVINAGVSGDTTAGGLARLDWSMEPGVNAAIVELGGNDLLRGIEPAASRANLDAILTKLRARGIPVLLVGLPAPLNYGPDYKAEFDAIFPDLAATHGAILYPFFFEGLRAGADPAAMAGLMQADGIHPSAEGVRRIVEHFGEAVLKLIAEVR